MNAATLRECPHCGGPAQLDDCRTIWRVICTSAACGALVPGDRAPEPEDGDEYPVGYWEAFEKSAIDRWNARPAIAPPVDAGSVESLTAAIDGFLSADGCVFKDILAWGAQQREAGRQEVRQCTAFRAAQARYNDTEHGEPL